MYVCVCRSITCACLRKEIANGTHHYPELCKRLGVGAQCGKCRKCAQKFFHKEMNKLGIFSEKR